MGVQTDALRKRLGHAQRSYTKGYKIVDDNGATRKVVNVDNVTSFVDSRGCLVTAEEEDEDGLLYVGLTASQLASLIAAEPACADTTLCAAMAKAMCEIMRCLALMLVPAKSNHLKKGQMAVALRAGADALAKAIGAKE